MCSFLCPVVERAAAADGGERLREVVVVLGLTRWWCFVAPDARAAWVLVVLRELARGSGRDHEAVDPDALILEGLPELAEVRLDGRPGLGALSGHVHGHAAVLER